MNDPDPVGTGKPLNPDEDEADTPRPKNVVRRFIGVVLCSLPAFLAVVCAAWPREVSGPRQAAGLTLVALALLIGGLNLNLIMIRPARYLRRHGSFEGFRFVSGVPMVGTLLVIAGCLAAFGSPLVGSLGLLAVLVDAGGLPWIPYLTWQDASLWDGTWTDSRRQPMETRY